MRSVSIWIVLVIVAVVLPELVSTLKLTKLETPTELTSNIRLSVLLIWQPPDPPLIFKIVPLAWSWAVTREVPVIDPEDTIAPDEIALAPTSAD